MASWLRPGANCKKEEKKYLVSGSQFFLGPRFLILGATKLGVVSISCFMLPLRDMKLHVYVTKNLGQPLV